MEFGTFVMHTPNWCKIYTTDNLAFAEWIEENSLSVGEDEVLANNPMEYPHFSDLGLRIFGPIKIDQADPEMRFAYIGTINTVDIFRQGFEELIFNDLKTGVQDTFGEPGIIEIGSFGTLENLTEIIREHSLKMNNLREAEALKSRHTATTRSVSRGL